MENKIFKGKIFGLILISLLFIFIIGALFLLTKRPKKEKIEVQKNNNLLISPINSPTDIQKGAYLKLKSDLNRLKVNQSLNMQIIADSAGEEIVGFDILLVYDKNAFDFVKALSLLSDFKVYTYESENYLVLTVVKSPQSNSPSIFKEMPVLTLSFTPKTSGQFVFILKEKIGKETTGLMNNKTERIVPALSDLKIEIE